MPDVMAMAGIYHVTVVAGAFGRIGRAQKVRFEFELQARSKPHVHPLKAQVGLDSTQQHVLLEGNK